MKKTLVPFMIGGLALAAVAVPSATASAAKSETANCYKQYGYFHVLHSGDGLTGKAPDGETITIPIDQGKWKITKAKNMNTASQCAAASHMFTQWLATESVTGKWRIAPYADKDGFMATKGKNGKKGKIKFMYAGM